MKWFLLILILSVNGSSDLHFKYKIDNKSRLFLNGKTSINTYECDCNDTFSDGFLTAAVNENGSFEFKDARIKIKTTLLSCKNKMMNRDMHKALKADQHPYIELEVHNAVGATRQMKDQKWQPFHSIITLSIAGISKKNQVEIFVNKLNDHCYRICGKKEIVMSDYDVKPRTPFNMIKIEDKVTINLDMIVTITEQH